MSQDATVNAGDIARLVDVGRAAVSNWRRRHDDFPQPVGGTASSPLFSLREVEDWLRRNGKTFQVSLADRTWQRLRAAGDDLRLGELVASAGELLCGSTSAPLADPELVTLITELAEERGPRDAFEFLCARYQEAHSRRLFTTPSDIAALMVDLVVPQQGSVLDPACGLGTLLLAAPPGTTRLGQELNDTAAAIAATRLELASEKSTVTTGDALRADGFPDELADAVVCDPPFNERAWGYQELTGDPRWEYGLPPRGEPELAWAQHCLAHTRPGGLVAVLMPAAAAGRRPGKRIRGNLLRAGALRAIVSLASGGPDLWLLRKPEPGDRPPSHLLLMSAHDDLTTVAPAWRKHLKNPDEATRIIDLLDDDVDLSPTRRRATSTGDELVRDLRAATRSLQSIGIKPPEFDVPAQRQALPVTTIGELVRAGLLTVRHGPARMATDTGDVPVLTSDDLAANRPPSGRTTDEPGLVQVAVGDVVASVLGAARVLTSGDAVLGPYLTRYRMDPDRLDPDFLAGSLRAAEPAAHTNSSRVDVRRMRVPRLPLAEQRRYGAAFRELVALADAVRAATSASETLVRLGFDGLVAGHLRPAE
ncbi:MAG TPA: N-6 DNA methylase [Pseudonocardiaceae bacterium]|nr:N-6 DNA methylase [Pseudonocardiaceae bacterium]